MQWISLLLPSFPHGNPLPCTPEVTACDIWAELPEKEEEKMHYGIPCMINEFIMENEKGIIMKEDDLLKRITFNPQIFGGKPIIRGMRIAVEHVLGMLAAGSMTEELLEGYPFLEKEDIQACMVFAYRMVAHERIEPALT